MEFIKDYRTFTFSLGLLFILVNLFFLFNKGSEFSKILAEKKYEQIILNQNSNFQVKSSDNFLLNLQRKKYNEISMYLNNKYGKLKLNSFKFKKKLKIYITESYNKKIRKWFLTKYLNDIFDIEFVEDNPDYIIIDVFGYRNKTFNNSINKAIKIAIFTENKIPDLNEADYALGQSHLNYLDRYFKYLNLIYLNYKPIDEIRKNFLKNNINRKKFCAAVISDINPIFSNNFRLRFIDELNKYKRIDMGGGYKNNVGGKVKNKIQFLSSYKFSIAMENTEGDGYVSEKIIDSFLAGTIPIYYGNYNVDEYINPKSYILIKGEEDIKKKIDLIIEIDNNEDKYLSMLKEKVILDKHVSEKVISELQLFLINIFSQDNSLAHRIDD